MKILFLGRYNESSVLTGPEKVANRIFNKSAYDFETAFITYFFDGRKYSLFKKLFGKEKISETGNRNIYRMGLLRILDFIFNFSPDIVHIITFERFAGFSFFHKIFPSARIFYTVHGIAAYENSVNPAASDRLKLKDYRSEITFMRDSDRLIFLSNRSVDTAEKYFPIDRKKAVIIPNGIDIIFHQIGQSKMISSNDIMKIVFVGDSGKKEKGLEFLKKALMKIEYPVKVFVIGDNYDSEKEESGRISFQYLNRMKTEVFAKFLYDKDIFISASSYEQFSMAAAEAMAAGLVPVVTEETGMSSYINENKNGYRFNFGDEVTLINILNGLNEDRAAAARISEEAKKIYFALSWEAVYLKYKSLYNEHSVSDGSS